MSRLPLIPLASLLLSACAVGPDYVRPDIAAPVSFKQAVHQDWLQLGDTRVLEGGEWWRIFGDPLLDELQTQVRIDNQNIKIAEAQYRAARAALDSAAAAYYPTLSGSLGGTRAANAVTTTSGTQTTGARPPTNTVTLSASASWELDVWGRIRRNNEAAGARVEASAADLAAARLSAHALLAQTYIQLRGAEAQLLLQQKTVSAYERYLQLTRNRFTAGVATPLDINTAESQLATARANVLAAELQRSQYEHAIATLIGKPPAALSLANTAVLPNQPPVPALVPSVWLTSRPDIVAAERRVAAANAQIGVASAAWFPSLTLTGSGGYRNDSLNNLISTPHRFWSLGPALAMTLFDAGARAAAVESATASYEQSVATYRQTVLTAFQEVEDNLAAARLVGAEKQERDIAAAAARRSREIASNQYQAGTVGQLEVTSAQATELAAERTLIDARQRHLLAAVQLYKNTGRVSEQPAETAR